MTAPTIVEQPYVIIFKREGHDEILTHIYKGDLTYEGYGLLVCDLVRHVAGAFGVDEDDVWEWVDKERFHRTTAVRAIRALFAHFDASFGNAKSVAEYDAIAAEAEVTLNRAFDAATAGLKGKAREIALRDLEPIREQLRKRAADFRKLH